ncbi:Ubiquinone/menaquinone biosynthesis C-methyltransferase UbiE [uncultured archaeon]|nr:Ubiquinone/menaquinone biosynthesis C-methyltransferase UbiE [uncultured archaeon]
MPKDYCAARPISTLVDTNLTAWDQDYRLRGRLWGSSAKGMPDLPENARILELGCGDGKTLAALAGSGRKVAALDVSLQALQLCRSVSPVAALILADACRLPFKQESFDIVFAFHVAGHLLLPGRHALAREVSRVLSSGGSLFFREFCVEDMRAGQGMETEPGTFRRGRGILTHYFTKGEVEALFCGLLPAIVGTHRWNLRVKGENMLRSEIEATFLKI